MCQEKFEKPVRPLEASLLLASSRPLAFPAAQLASCCSAHPPTLFGLAFDHINFVQNIPIEFTLNVDSSASAGMRGGGIAQPCVKWALSKISIQGRSYLEVSTWKGFDLKLPSLFDLELSMWKGSNLAGWSWTSPNGGSARQGLHKNLEPAASDHHCSCILSGACSHQTSIWEARASDPKIPVVPNKALSSEVLGEAVAAPDWGLPSSAHQYPL